jgi:hypothetical protein
MAVKIEKSSSLRYGMAVVVIEKVRTAFILGPKVFTKGWLELGIAQACLLLLGGNKKLR